MLAGVFWQIWFHCKLHFVNLFVRSEWMTTFIWESTRTYRILRFPLTCYPFCPFFLWLLPVTFLLLHNIISSWKMILFFPHFFLSSFPVFWLWVCVFVCFPILLCTSGNPTQKVSFAAILVPLRPCPLPLLFSLPLSAPWPL